MDALILADARERREARLSAGMSERAAVLLPLMLSLARLQARCDGREQAT
jgi:hypothetical protein